ncbi:MAG TPA: hypothetical protein VH054_20375 [Polyangiaceae bacterium]|nr:hypothetical protein [Polyangiaceae bacterium]
MDRVPIGTTNYVVGTATGALLSKPLVRGDDVFAYANQGTDGWARYYRVNPDGSVVDFINKLQHFMSALAADTSWIYWVDAYGATSPSGAQPTTELWSAPYTSDLATLQSTGKMLAVISATRGDAVAFNGYWAGLLGVNDIWIARAADGTTWHLTPEPNRRFNSIAYIDDKEVWVVEDFVPDAGAFTLGVAFERIAYAN